MAMKLVRPDTKHAEGYKSGNQSAGGTGPSSDRSLYRLMRGKKSPAFRRLPTLLPACHAFPQVPVAAFIAGDGSHSACQHSVRPNAGIQLVPLSRSVSSAIPPSSAPESRDTTLMVAWAQHRSTMYHRQHRDKAAPAIHKRQS